MLLHLRVLLLLHPHASCFRSALGLFTKLRQIGSKTKQGGLEVLIASKE